MKRLLKALMPSKLYAASAQIGQGVAARIVSPMVGILSLDEAIKLRLRLKSVAFLDYPNAMIRMTVETPMQRVRLGACRKEPETIAWIERFIQRGDIFYDIGANVGAYSFVVNAVTKGDSLVFAFEPSFSTFAALCHNVILNGCQGTVVPLNIALSNKTSLLSLRFSDISPGAALHSIQESSFRRGDDSLIEQPVLTFRLDDFVSRFGLRLPNHLKIDVDGSELEVIRGALNTLSMADVRSALVEIDHEKDVANEIQCLMAERGFEVLSRHPRAWNTAIENCVFVRQS